MEKARFSPPKTQKTHGLIHLPKTMATWPLKSDGSEQRAKALHPAVSKEYPAKCSFLPAVSLTKPEKNHTTETCYRIICQKKHTHKKAKAFRKGQNTKHLQTRPDVCKNQGLWCNKTTLLGLFFPTLNLLLRFLKLLGGLFSLFEFHEK